MLLSKLSVKEEIQAYIGRKGRISYPDEPGRVFIPPKTPGTEQAIRRNRVHDVSIKVLRVQRRNSGLCVRCGEKSDPYRYCKTCRDYDRKRMYRKRNFNRVEE